MGLHVTLSEGCPRSPIVAVMGGRSIRAHDWQPVAARSPSVHCRWCGWIQLVLVEPERPSAMEVADTARRHGATVEGT